MKNNVEISKAVSEILTKRPKTLIRYGSAVMLLVILLILFFYFSMSTTG